jgi:dTDP-4-amino-4,6-dideoxygalactose transaminase
VNRALPLVRIANAPGLAPGMAEPTGRSALLPSWLPAGRSVLFAAARHGLYHGWKLLGLPAGSAVLVPAFVCDTVSGPLQLAGARLVFYRVNRDLSPDLDHAAEVLRRKPRIRALLWYRYLGFDVGIREAREFCRRHRLAFIEDCAHALPVGPAGTLGDIAVFSIRKLLPVTNAGALVVNNRALLPLPEPAWRRPDRQYETVLKEKERNLRRLHQERLPSGGKLAREALRGHVAYVAGLNSARRTVREAARRRLHGADRLLANMARPLPPDALSRRVIANADLRAIARARQRNCREYLRHIGELALFPRLPAGAAPLGFPIRVPDRDEFRLRLARLGVAGGAYWPDWILPAGARRGFATERWLADHLLALPCHQDLGPEDIESICRAVRQSWQT